MTDTESYRLPLFPLPVVLLPGVQLPLHVFEPRYRQMVGDCLAGDRRFGLIYHDWDRQGPFVGEEGRIGCVAEIQRHELLTDGRSLLVVHGAERFRIDAELDMEAMYFEAMVTPYPDTPGDSPEGMSSRRAASIRLFRAALGTTDRADSHLPPIDDAVDVSFPLASMLRVAPAWHQRILELRDERERLDLLDRVFRDALR